MYPPGNLHIPYEGNFEDDVPFPMFFFSSLEGTWMSQDVCKWLVNGLQPQYTPFQSGL